MLYGSSNTATSETKTFPTIAMPEPPQAGARHGSRAVYPTVPEDAAAGRTKTPQRAAEARAESYGDRVANNPVDRRGHNNHRRCA